MSNAIVYTPYGVRQTVTLFPGGELSYRILPSYPRKSSSKDSRDFSISVSSETHDTVRSLVSDDLSVSVSRKTPDFSKSGSHSDPLLDSNSEFHPSVSSSHSKSGTPGYGSLPGKIRGLTRYAKRQIKLSAAAIEQRFGKEQCVFLTGTLPGSTYDALAAFAQWSSWLMDRLQKWLRKHFSIDGSLYHLGVWELQKRGALHYHALIAVPPHLVDKLLSSFKPYWISLLKQVSEYSGVDVFKRSRGGSWLHSTDKVQTFAQVVQKSVTAYLSKYLSKGNGDVKGFGSFNGFPPARWWSCTRAVKTVLKEETKQFILPQVSYEQLLECDSFISSVLTGADCHGETVGSSFFTGKKLGYVGFYNSTIAASENFEFLKNLCSDWFESNTSVNNQFYRQRWSSHQQFIKQYFDAQYFQDCDLTLDYVHSKTAPARTHRFVSYRDWQDWIKSGSESFRITTINPPAVAGKLKQDSA